MIKIIYTNQHEKIKLENELLSALIIEYFYKKKFNRIINLIVGDDPKKQFPDLYSFSKKIGFEIISCLSDKERAQIAIFHDFKKKKIKIVNNKISKKINKTFIFNTNPQLGYLGYDSIEFHKDSDYREEIYKKAIITKYSKLNKNNYISCKYVYLVLNNFFHSPNDGELAIKTFSLLQSVKHIKDFTGFFFINDNYIWFYKNKMCYKLEIKKLFQKFILNKDKKLSGLQSNSLHKTITP